MQEDLNQEIQDMHQRQAIRFNNFFNNYRTSTVVSNKECQTQHQDLDATIKVQCIVHRFIICRQQQAKLEHLVRKQQCHDAATKIQSSF
eukprot:13485382-Ditylum_brightwellii.AAC.1